MAKHPVILGFVVLFIFSALPNFVWLFDLGSPAHNAYDTDWPEIQKIWKKDTVSNGLAFAFVFIGAIVYSFFFSLASCCFLKSNFLKTLLLALIAFEFCFGVCGTITSTLKFSVARFRPYFLQTCAPNMDEVRRIKAEQESQYGYHFAYDFPCTGKEKEVNEARRSFPSGHSSMALCTAFFCSFLCFRYAYNYDKSLHTKGSTVEEGLTVSASVTSLPDSTSSSSSSESKGEEKTGEELPPFYKTRQIFYVVASFLSLPIVVSALFIAGSRVADNKHNLSDVVAGMIVGCLSGAIAMFVVIFGEYEILRRTGKKTTTQS